MVDRLDDLCRKYIHSEIDTLVSYANVWYHSNDVFLLPQRMLKSLDIIQNLEFATNGQMGWTIANCHDTNMQSEYDDYIDKAGLFLKRTSLKSLRKLKFSTRCNIYPWINKQQRKECGQIIREVFEKFVKGIPSLSVPEVYFTHW